LHRDLPYKRGLHWRSPSYLLKEGNEELLKKWRKTFEDATEMSIWMLTFMPENMMPGTPPSYEPIRRECGHWRSLGPGRRYTDEEILEADDLVNIELIRERYPR
jgi:hypothetical protein